MRRRTVLKLVSKGALTVAVGCSSKPLRAFVTNDDSNDVTVIDVGRLKVLATIQLGKRPRGARLSPNGAWLYVALSGSSKTLPSAEDAELPPVLRSADGIGVVDVGKLTLTRIVPCGEAPESFDLTPDGTRLVVSNQGTAEANVVDLAAGTVLWSATAGGEPEGVAVHPDGAVAYVTSEADDLVSVIDLRLGKRIATIPTGKRPHAVTFDRAGDRAYVTAEMDGSVTVIDARAHEAVSSISLDNFSARPTGLRVTPDGDHLVVTNGRGGSVSIVSLPQGRVVRTVTGVTARPRGVDLTPDGSRAFVACGPSNDVAVIDVESGVLLERIAAGHSPWGICIEPKARG
jgi:YVTN family beta-propeller protein